MGKGRGLQELTNLNSVCLYHIFKLRFEYEVGTK